MVSYSGGLLCAALLLGALSTARSTSVKRFSRPPSTDIDEVNITSLLPASYTVMGPNVKASGSYHRATSRTGLAAQTMHSSDHSLGSIFKVHRSTDEDDEETLSSQPDISSMVGSTSTTASDTSTQSPSLGIRKLREKFPRLRPRFGSRLKTTSSPDSAGSRRSDSTPPQERKTRPAHGKSKANRHEPLIINRPQQARERTHYRTISSPNPQIVDERRVTPSLVTEAEETNTIRKDYRNKFDQILKRERTPQRQQSFPQGNRKIEGTSNFAVNSVDSLEENSDITRERSNPEWSSHPKESSIVQSTQPEINKSTKPDYLYPKIKSTTTFTPATSFKPNRDFSASFPVRPLGGAPAAPREQNRAISSHDQNPADRPFTLVSFDEPNRPFAPVSAVKTKRPFTPVSSVESKRPFAPVSSVESSRSFTPVSSVEPTNFTPDHEAEHEGALSPERNRVKNEREHHDSNYNKNYHEIKRAHSINDRDQKEVGYPKPRDDEKTGFPPVYTSNKNSENRWSPNSWEHRRNPSVDEDLHHPTVAPEVPDNHESSLNHKDSSRELFRDDVKKFTADPEKHLQYPRAHHTFHRHFYSDYEEEESLISTDQKNSKQTARNGIPDWAFDPKWHSSHEILEPHSPSTTTTEKIIARPTIVPGALDVVRRSEFPFEFWRPDNLNFEEDAGNRRSEKNENAPPLNFREVPEHLFTVGNGPVAVPEELARKTFETVTAAPSFDLMSNPFHDDQFGHFSPPAQRESVGGPNFNIPQFEWTSDLEEFESENKRNHFGKESPQSFHNAGTPPHHRPPFNRDTFSGNAAIQQSPINVRQTGIPHLRTTSIPHESANRVPSIPRPVQSYGVNEVPHAGIRTTSNKQLPRRGVTQHHVPNASHRPKQNFLRHPEKLPSLRPPTRGPQNAAHLNHRLPNSRVSKPSGHNRPFGNRPQQRPLRGSNVPHRLPNVNHFNGEPLFSGSSHFQAVNPHSKYSTAAPEYLTRSHFEVKHHSPVMRPSNHVSSIKNTAIGHPRPLPPNNNLVYGADPQEEQSLQPYIPPNHYVPQQIVTRMSEIKKTTRPRIPIKHRRQPAPKKVHAYQSSSIWSALTNFDLNYFNPFGHNSNSAVDRVATAAALPTSVLVPGSLAVLGAGLSLFYFNFVWHPTPVVKARLANVLQNWSHSNVLTVEQQQAIGDVTKVYSALSSIATTLGELDERRNSTTSSSKNTSNHEVLVSQPCKNKMVCQTYTEFEDLFDITKSTATLLGSTLDHLDQEMLLEFLLAADRGHHSAKAGNHTCDDFYPACPLPSISVKATLQDLVGITPTLDKDHSKITEGLVQHDHNSLDVSQEIQETEKDSPSSQAFSAAANGTRDELEAAR